jgi:hypothetical protein
MRNRESLATPPFPTTKHSAALSPAQRDGRSRLAKLLSVRACTAHRACYVREIRFLNTMNDCSGANLIAGRWFQHHFV